MLYPFPHPFRLISLIGLSVGFTMEGSGDEITSLRHQLLVEQEAKAFLQQELAELRTQLAKVVS